MKKIMVRAASSLLPVPLLVLLTLMMADSERTSAFLGSATRVFSLGEKVIEDAFVVFRSGGPRGYQSLMNHTAQLRLGNARTAELFIRVAVKDGRIAAHEAETLYRSLRDVPGFSRAAKWMLVGERNSSPFVGSLQELRIAGNLQKSGYKVVELRAPFRGDPAKRFTDIDLVVEKGGKRFAIESKAYEKGIHWDQLAPDVETLKAYERVNPKTTCYLLFKQKPSDLVIRKLNDNGIKHLIVGDLGALKYLEL